MLVWLLFWGRLNGTALPAVMVVRRGSVMNVEDADIVVGVFPVIHCKEAIIQTVCHDFRCVYGLVGCFCLMGEIIPSCIAVV